MRNRSEIFIELAYREMNSPDKGIYYLSYEKIRAYAANRRGHFTKKDFIECTGLSHSKALTHLFRLIEKGFAIRVKDTDQFKIIKPRHVLGYFEKEHTAFVPHDMLFSFSWKNMASWRALLTELIIQRNRIQRASLKYSKNKKVDKSQLSIDFDGDSSASSQNISKWDSKMSLSYMEILNGCGISTNHKYRSLQKVSSYKSKKAVYQDFDRPDRIDMISEKLMDLKGKAFEYNDKLYLIEASERTRLPYSESGIGFGKNKRFSPISKYKFYHRAA